MAQDYTSLSDLLAHGFDTVIDVRSPAEFAEDHVPGALNLPVLDNEERAEIGTIYKQISPFEARKAGAARVFRNSARHIEDALCDKSGAWRPLVYCWRGGQRSGAFSWMLSQIGWRADVIDGGYRRFRRLVKAMLYDQVLPWSFIALDGYTGTAKTELLHLAAARGVQVLDLEGAARHRGSLLGATAVPQPSQKMFESDIAATLCSFCPTKPVLIEAESSKIGARSLPPSLWTALRHAPRIDVTAPMASRCRYLTHAYADILSDKDRLRARLDPLRDYRGHAVVQRWNDLSAAGDTLALTRALMADHYDPAYDKGRRAFQREQLAQLDLQDLAPATLHRAADQLADIVGGASLNAIPTAPATR